MYIEEIIGIMGHLRRADKSAVGAINRPLQWAGVVCTMAWSAPTEGRRSLFHGMIGLHGWPEYVVTSH